MEHVDGVFSTVSSIQLCQKVLYYVNYARSGGRTYYRAANDR